jgi:hypothetical protein
MDRREFNSVWMPVLGACLGLPGGAAQAMSLADLSQGEASQGLKTALEQGAKAAVLQLGQPNGYLGNEKVRIPLPGYLNEAATLLRTLGQGQQLDELVTAMNRAAEAAVPQARDLLLGAVRSMGIEDAKKILSGGDTSVTTFFAEKNAHRWARNSCRWSRAALKSWAWRTNTTRLRAGRRNWGWWGGMRPASSSTSPAKRWMGCIS